MGVERHWFFCGAIAWQDGAPQAKRAFHDNSRGPSVTCAVCLLRRPGILSSLDQKLFPLRFNFQVVFLVVGQISGGRIDGGKKKKSDT